MVRTLHLTFRSAAASWPHCVLYTCLPSRHVCHRAPVAYSLALCGTAYTCACNLAAVSHCRPARFIPLHSTRLLAVVAGSFKLTVWLALLSMVLASAGAPLSWLTLQRLVEGVLLRLGLVFGLLVQLQPMIRVLMNDIIQKRLSTAPFSGLGNKLHA